MNGAESLVRTLLASGVDTCFANPGTSEMHFVAALDRIPGMRCVLGLHENVVTGMADGYYRMVRKPACTLLHCGPGLGNGLANLHNARRARSGIVNIVGDQATYHRPHDAPLTADTDALARTVSAWVRTSTRAGDVGRDAAAAVQAARTMPGEVATLILPSDASWDEGGALAEPLPVPAPPALDPSAVENAARVLRGRSNVLILLAGAGVLGPCQALAWRIAKATGATIMGDYVNGRVARGRGSLQLERVPYVADVAIATLARFEHLILVNAKPPVGFFAYPGKPSRHHNPEAVIHTLSRHDQDAEAALRALVDELGAPEAAIPDPGPRPEPARGAITSEALGRTLAALMPDDAIVSDESVSYGRGFSKHTYAAPAHGLVEPDGWRHRRRLAGGDRRGGRNRRPAARDQPPGGRLGDVFAPEFLDAGAGEAALHDDHPVQPQVPDPGRRVRQRRRHARRDRDEHARPRRPGHRLGQDREWDGGSRPPGRRPWMPAAT